MMLRSWRHWKLARSELSLLLSRSTVFAAFHDVRTSEPDGFIIEENVGKFRKQEEATVLTDTDARNKQVERLYYGSSVFKIGRGTLTFHCGHFGASTWSPHGSISQQLRFRSSFVRRVSTSDASDVHSTLLPDPESHFHSGSHVMMAEAVHSLADLANQGLLAYGLMSSRRAPDALHPYGYQKERFVWSLISAVGIFCLGSGATIVHGVQHLWDAAPIDHVAVAASVLVGSAVMEGASLLVAMSAVRKGAASEGMTVRDYIWRGHDPTSVAVLMEDGAAVTGLAVAAAALAAVHITGNPIWDPIGSIIVGNLLGVVAIFLIQMNRQALIGRSIDDSDLKRIIKMLSKQPVVDAVYDCKSEVIGPGQYRFKAEIDFNGVQIVQNYLERAGRTTWVKEFRDAVNDPREGAMDRVMANYGEEVVSAVGSEIDKLEKEIQLLVPGIRHVDIEAHNPKGPSPHEKFYSSLMDE